MKETRRIDELGRVVIPKVFRRALDIKEGDILAVVLHDEGVSMELDDKRLECVITGEKKGVELYCGTIPLSEKGLQLIKQELKEI